MQYKNMLMTGITMFCCPDICDSILFLLAEFWLFQAFFSIFNCGFEMASFVLAVSLDSLSIAWMWQKCWFLNVPSELIQRAWASCLLPTEIAARPGYMDWWRPQAGKECFRYRMKCCWSTAKEQSMRGMLEVWLICDFSLWGKDLTYRFFAILA